jgi:glyoxylase I family protein
MSDFPALAHVAITVRDLQVSAPWYEALFDSGPAIDEDTDPDMHHTVFVVGNGTLVGLHQHRVRSTEMFSEYRPGLDHLAFGCSSREDLEKWTVRLDELGIAHGAIKDAHYGSGLSFRDPDGIALEFFSPPA